MEDNKNIDEEIKENSEENSLGNEEAEEEAVENNNENDTDNSADEEVEKASDSDGDDAEKNNEDSSEKSSQKDGKGNDKKGFFKKDKKKDKKDELIEELTDKYKRTFAEFDNFRKRSEKEKSAMYEVGAKSVIEKILPVVDNFERGFKSVSDEEKVTPFAEGMDKIYKQLIKTLEDLGVTEIEAEGKEFNPDFHNAVMHIEDEEYGENVIAEVLQKGYMYRESVVRHSMVKVAN